MLDLKIVGGQVVDGTGAAARARRRGRSPATPSPPWAISRGSRRGGPSTPPGLTVTPGFIDMHSHSDWRLWGNRRAESKIRQGVTTEVVGNCGFSPAPVSDEFREEMRGFALSLPPGMDFSWRSMARLPRAATATRAWPLNVVQLVGHGTLRLAAMGFARRPPTARELVTMERLMDEAMASGAYGLATGLIYAPGSYADTEEIVAIARARRARRGFYASHIRGEGATLLDAVGEAIRVGREGELPVQVSHIKAAGRPNWGKVEERARADRRRARGRRSGRDGRRLSLHRVEHHAAHAPARLGARGRDRGDARAPRGPRGTRDRIRQELTGGSPILARGLGWDDIMIASSPSRPDAEGRRLDEIAPRLAHRSARRRHRPPRGRARQGLRDPLPARRGRPPPRPRASRR